MSRRQRTSPSRELRESAATAKRAAFDPLAIAREIVAALADAVVVTGTDRRILTANRAAGALFGRPPADLPGTAIADLVVSAERQHLAARERRAGEGGQQHYATEGVRADDAARRRA